MRPVAAAAAETRAFNERYLALAGAETASGVWSVTGDRSDEVPKHCEVQIGVFRSCFT